MSCVQKFLLLRLITNEYLKDSAQRTRNSPLISYFDVTNQFPWQEPRAEQIRQRRTLLYNSLIFDILLTSGGIREPYLLFPPENVESLQKLLDAIQSSTYDTLKKDCLVYFLLKFYQDGRENGFQQQRCIPPQFAALADAYWHLDTGINVPVCKCFFVCSKKDFIPFLMHSVRLPYSQTVDLTETTHPRYWSPCPFRLIQKRLSDDIFRQ